MIDAPIMCQCTIFQAWRCGQGKYALEILNRFKMMDSMTNAMASNMNLLSDASSETVDATMYRQMIGSLMYLTNARPDICFVVNTLIHIHLMVANHAVRYLKGTFYYGLKYEVNQKINLEGYVDSDWASSSIDRKEHLRVLL